MEMALNCFQNSAEPINDYKVSVGAFVGIVGKNVGKKLSGIKATLLFT
jgi:hypothetical protein